MNQPEFVSRTIYMAVTEKLPQITAPKANKSSLSRTLLQVAGMAILLGLIVETVILIVAASFGKVLAAKPFLADLTQKVSWSVIVCLGLALARGATRLFAATVQAALVGLAGLLMAPPAFAVARSLYEGVQEALFIKVFQGGGGSPVLLALIKGIEYGCLGALLVWVSKQCWGNALTHAGAGLLIGIVFGAVFIGAMSWGATASMTLGTMISRALNEILNPVGCALTLYSAEILRRTQTARTDEN
ncbi:MAG: hypothetical protein JNK38_22560 [Acidobacteria bacterium]|nr:hypothetical protein [Acidobacteriota bacterium]